MDRHQEPLYEPSKIREWMRLAVNLGKQSVSEGDPTKPYVGAVVVQEGEVVGSGYRGMTGSGNHAEYGVLQGIAPELLKGAVVLSTLEPCSNRNHPKIPCAQRLVDAKVNAVHIGICDPNPTIYRQGWLDPKPCRRPSLHNRAHGGIPVDGVMRAR